MASRTLERITPYIDSATAAELADLEAQMDAACPEGENIDLAQAAWWYSAHYHSGQWSDLYRLAGATGYHPGALESGPGDASRLYYSILESGA